MTTTTPAVPAMAPPASPPRRPPARRRSPAMASLGVVLVAVCALGAYQYAAHQAATTGSYLAVYQRVDSGARLSAADLQTVRITAAAGLTPIPAARLDTIIGEYATTTLMPGTLLVDADVARTRTIADGQAIAGLHLTAAQRPGRALHPGDRVRLVAQPDPSGTPTAGAPTLPSGLVVTVVDVADPDSSGGEVVDVLVPDADVGPITALASLDRIAIVLVGEG